MIKLQRQVSANHLNEICNHPSIYPWVHGQVQGPLDFSKVINEESPHVNLMGKHGGMLFVQHQLGFYEEHAHVLPAGRGKWAYGMVVEALHYMFTQTDAVEIWGRVPHGNLRARALMRAIARDFKGAKQFRSERGWIIDDKIVPADIYSLTIQEWMRNAPNLVVWGEWFHSKLDEEYRRLGREGIQPSNSDANRFIGAAVEMIRGGQPNKGMVFYNRWARMADYTPLTLVNLDPVMINIGDALLELHGSNFFVSQLGGYTQ